MSKHTPGPWAWQKLGNHRMLVAQHGLRDIIIGSLAVEMPQETYVTTNVDGILRPVEPDNPNAKLIAAAPTLLEELKMLVDYVRRELTLFHPDITEKEQNFIVSKAADGSIVNGWLASQTDMLAEDWQLV